eukprot:8454036-Ditylum_brightwellii.AAC.1
MAYIIRQFLSHDDILPKDAKDLRNTVSAANSNGYTALYNLLCYMKHAALSDEVVETSIPCQCSTEILSAYIQGIKNYIE